MTETEDGSGKKQHRAIASIPAIYVDSYSLAWWPEGVRISFAEYLYDEPHYRLAVTMPLNDAEALGRALLASVKKARAPGKESDVE